VKKQLTFWVERYLYAPTFIDRLISYTLLPLSFIYCLVVYLKYLFATPQDMGIKVVSIGNLTVGGSGKTPLVSALAKEYSNVAVVLRGYGRRSKGIVVVKDKERILCDVAQSGDEAMIYAKKLPHAVVIVSENRKEGIKKAKEYGVDLVFLDDGYSKHNIKKLDFVIDVKTPNRFCLPSGAYRELAWSSKEMVLLEEEKDFKRISILKDQTQKMCLITAIARPQRLDRYLPKVIAKYYFEDHHDFTYEELKKIWDKEQPTSFLVTYKDYVKLERFGFPLSLLDLELEVEKRVFQTINNMLK